MLDALPPIPIALQWLLMVVIPGAVAIWRVIHWVWRRWLSDWWAKRNRDRLMRRAQTVAAEYHRLREINSDPRRVSAFLARQVLSALTGMYIVLIMTFILFPIASKGEGILSVVVTVVWIGLVSSFAPDVYIPQRAAIFEDFPKYEAGMTNRLQKLLRAALSGLSPEEVDARVRELLGSDRAH
jgi:hypothetical protein